MTTAMMADNTAPHTNAPMAIPATATTHGVNTSHTNTMSKAIAF